MISFDPYQVWHTAKQLKNEKLSLPVLREHFNLLVNQFKFVVDELELERKKIEALEKNEANLTKTIADLSDQCRKSEEQISELEKKYSKNTPEIEFNPENLLTTKDGRFTFLIHDYHPRKAICPKCAEHEIITYLEYGGHTQVDNILDNTTINTQQRLYCPKCHYEDELPDELQFPYIQKVTDEYLKKKEREV